MVHEIASELYSIEQKALKWAYKRLRILLNTLKIVDKEKYGPLKLVASLATMCSTLYKGFTVIIQPYPED